MARRNLTYDAIGAGLGGFVDTATKMINFADNIEDRKLRREQMLSQEKRQTAQDERQVRIDEETRLRNERKENWDLEDREWKGKERQETEAKRLREEEKLQREESDFVRARDYAAIQQTQRMTPGMKVDAGYLPVLGRLVGRPLESAERIENGIRLTAKKENPFILTDGQKQIVLDIPEEKLDEMTRFNLYGDEERGVSPLSAYGFSKIGELYRTFQLGNMDPTQQSAALNTIIKTLDDRIKLADEGSGQSAREMKNRLMAERGDYLQMLQKLLGHSVPEVAKYTTTRGELEERSLLEYKSASQKYVGMNEGQLKKIPDRDTLDSLWMLSGRPRNDAPHRTRQWQVLDQISGKPVVERPDALSQAVPTREELVRESGRSAALPAVKAAPAVAAGQPAQTVKVFDSTAGKEFAVPADKVEEALKIPGVRLADPAAAASSRPDGKVKVIDGAGKEYLIPADKVGDALKVPGVRLAE